MRKSYNGQSVFFYVNILPSFYGEKILVRVVPHLEKLPDFAQLCGDRQSQESLQRLAQESQGLVVVIGAAYGGKTTTMEAFWDSSWTRIAPLPWCPIPLSMFMKTLIS
ncbi:ATPase, T2SS/T4P/T4SS family [Synechocystis sp. B12]|nr:ATPase, T2SS/T4P/T4SS family [Synechocystis sp. B12]